VGVALAQSGPAAGSSIGGVWEGTSIVRTGAGASTIPKRLPNLTIITSGGHYSSVAQENGVTPVPPRKPLPPLKTPGQPTDAEKIARADLRGTMIAHSGTYQLKGNMVMQQRMADVTATANVTTFEFSIEDAGKTLELIAKAPDSETVRTFRRLE